MALLALKHTKIQYQHPIQKNATTPNCNGIVLGSGPLPTKRNIPIKKYCRVFPISGVQYSGTISKQKEFKKKS